MNKLQLCLSDVFVCYSDSRILSLVESPSVKEVMVRFWCKWCHHVLTYKRLLGCMRCRREYISTNFHQIYYIYILFSFHSNFLFSLWYKLPFLLNTHAIATKLFSSHEKVWNFLIINRLYITNLCSIKVFGNCTWWSVWETSSYCQEHQTPICYVTFFPKKMCIYWVQNNRRIDIK